MSMRKPWLTFALPLVMGIFVCESGLSLASSSGKSQEGSRPTSGVLVHRAMKNDVSRPLTSMRVLNDTSTAPECEGAACGNSPVADSEDLDDSEEQRREEPIPPPPPKPTLTPAGVAIEQTSQGIRPAVPLIESFDGLGAGFEGP
jgi:hypothetical protein